MGGSTMEATIQIRDGQDFPEDMEYAGSVLSYDPEDPGSVARAQRLLQLRFGLSRPPVLCSAPEPSFLEKLTAFFGQLWAPALR